MLDNAQRVEPRPASDASAAPAVDSGSAPAPLVRLVDVRKAFDGTAALDGISLDVSAGEILGIIGRSGAGKSTLIRCLNGLERPDSGTVEVLGRDLAALQERALRPIRARIGMIFQHFNLLSAKTVAENVALPLVIAGTPADERRGRVADLLALVGLDGKASSYPAQLSGGQKQRVGIARALAAKPALLLSDEATSALDPETTNAILALLRDINRQLGLTIVMITHEMSVVRAIADRVVVLERGRVVEAGSTAQVFAAPQAELTQRLIASSFHVPVAVPHDRLQATYSPGLYAVLRVMARGEAAARPLVGHIAEVAGIAPLVLRAEIDRVGAEPVANLVLALPDLSPDRVAVLGRSLDQRSSLEVIGYARDPV